VNTKNNKISVIIFTGGLKAGGAEKQSRLLAVSLNKIYNIYLIAYHGDQYLQRNIVFLNSENVKLHRLYGHPIKKNLQFCSLLLKIKPNGIINFLPSNNLIGGFWGRLFRIKMVIGSIRTTKIDTRFKHLQLLFSHYFFNHITVFNSYAGLNYNCTKGFRIFKSTVIQNCIYPIPPIQEREMNNEIVILMVSRFEKYKDYFTALIAFEKLLSGNSNRRIKLQIVGIGPLENKIRNWIEEHQLEANIDVAINPENIEDYFKNASIFLQTSTIEGFSNSIMEAMAYALPIVATDVGDNRYMVIEGTNGYLVPIKQPMAIVSALSKIIDFDQKRIEMGRKSYDLITTNYSIEWFAKKFQDIIR
jgi:glycosyltransferase involved in cell wall biosynthesis